MFLQTANKLRDEYVSHANSHDSRRSELDLLRLEIDDLRRALDERDTDLQRAEKERRKVSAEKTDVARTVAALEADLRRVRRDAETFGHDLTLLRREKEALEADNKEELARAGRAKKQAQTQIRLFTEQLEAQKDKTMHALEQLRSHVCNVYVPWVHPDSPYLTKYCSDVDKVAKLKLQHNKECKGLMVQIRYLKAKFSRESVFRENLTSQKQYLLTLLKQFEKRCVSGGMLRNNA